MEQNDFRSGAHDDTARNYRELKARVDQGLREAGKSSDSRTAKGILINLQSAFKGVRLQREDREELYGRLQEAFDKVNEEIARERAAFEVEALNNYNDLRIIVEEAVHRSSTTQNPREAKGFLIEAQQSFRELRLVKEQREELYNRLQQAFQAVNNRLDQERQSQVLEEEDGYRRFKPRVDQIKEEALQGKDPALVKERLISLQAELKELRVYGEKRQSLYDGIQEVFDILHRHKEEEEAVLRDQAEATFPVLAGKVDAAFELAQNSNDFKLIREQLKDLQAELKVSPLLREQKDILYDRVQEAFLLVNKRQDEERSSFEEEAAANYQRLKKLVNDGLTQAQESHEYKETREFLKKIQSEFKGIRMMREEREELYARLQSAFDILSQRVDTFFREKQKNWEVRMNFKLKDLEVSAGQLREDISRDKEELGLLENHLEILDQNPRDAGARYSLLARIESVRETISRNLSRLEDTESEIVSLQKRLTDDTAG